MAKSATIPSCAKLRLQKSCLKVSDFAPRNAFFRIGQRKHSYGTCRVVVRLSSQEVCELSAPITTILRGSQCLREGPLSRCFLGSSVNPVNAMPSNWVFVVDQVLLVASVVLTYMAGVIPSEKAYFSSRKKISDFDEVPANSSSSGSGTRSDQQVSSEYAWDKVKRKLLGALNTIEHDGNLDNRAVEYEKYSPKRPLCLYAISEGPRLRLLWATLQRLEQEVVNISGNYGVDCRKDWLEVLSKIIQKSCQPVCLAWVEEELYLENRKSDKALLCIMHDKLKGADPILQNIKKLGKEDLFADLLFFLRFGSIGGVCCYDCKLLTEHGVDILEDLVITLADGITGIYLDLISVDSNFSSEMSSLGLILCSLSTRSLQRLRNEVALNQWLYQNMESVVSMYEDCFDLCTLQVQLLEEPKKSGNERFYWWKRIRFRKPAPILSQLPYLVISQLSISVKRTKELRALTGWRYYFSLFLEFSDIAMPIVKVVYAKVSSAISFFLVCLIGRSLGLIYTGIRQSLRWRF